MNIFKATIGLASADRQAAARSAGRLWLWGAMAALLLAAPCALAADAPAAASPAAMDRSEPPAPDYSKPENWAARPGHEGAAAAVAPGASPRAINPAADVFYIHPTTDISRTRFYSPLSDSEINRWTDESVVARQGGVWNGCCRVFAPRYRQATAGSWLTPQTHKETFALAYSDVLRAFDDYIKNDNHGRPFILVGHSQGAAHLARLLEERIDGTPLRKQLIVAYVIGINVAEGDFGRTYKTIRSCDTPLQTGCVLAWNSMLPDGDPRILVNGTAKAFKDRYGDVPGGDLVCINPLTFDRSKPAAGSEASKGAVPGDPGFGPLRPLMPHAVSARCQGGMLIVEPNPALGLKPLVGGAMHYHDIGLFYEDIRENAVQRVQAFLMDQPR
jgi:hypothetical protein